MASLFMELWHWGWGPYPSALRVLYCPSKTGDLETSRRKYEVPWLHGQVLPRVLALKVWLLSYWDTMQTVFSMLGKQQRSQKQLWEESSLGFGAPALTLWYSCTHPYESCLLMPDLPPWLGPRGALSPWPTPAWLCWSPLGVGDWVLGEGPCSRLPHCWPPQPDPADNRDLGVSEARQGWVEIQGKKTHMNWATPLALKIYGCLCKATAMGLLNLPLEGFWNEEDYCSIQNDVFIAISIFLQLFSTNSIYIFVYICINLRVEMFTLLIIESTSPVF